MTTILVLLLIVSPISSIIMVTNQRKLEKQFKEIEDNIKYLKENSLLLSNEDIRKAIKKQLVNDRMSSIGFNTDGD